MVSVFVALSRDQAARLRDGDAYEGPGHAPTPALLAAHDLVAGEEADYTALAYAGVSALRVDGDSLRLVVAANLDAAQIRDLADPFGVVRVVDLRWSRVTALFADAVEALDDLREARALAGGRALAEVVDDPAVERLVDGADLLWFAPDEFDVLPTP